MHDGPKDDGDGKNRKSTITRAILGLSFFLLIVLLAGILLVVGEGALRRAGSVLLAICCSLTVGGLIGFLFGIPRALAAAPDVAAPVDPQNEAPAPAVARRSHSGFSHNTNLEQISDWLTKIIVGVSLVQARDIAEEIGALSRLAANAWSWPDGAVVAGFLLVGCALIGFLSVYIWTRTDFIIYLESNQSDLDALIRERNQAYAERDSAIDRKTEAERSAMNEAARFLSGTRALSETEAPTPERRETLQVREETPPYGAELRWRQLYDSDPHKGMFGESPTAQGLTLTAEVTRLRAEGLKMFGVRLAVAHDDGSPVQGTVRFHLHPTFSPSIVDVAPADGVAELRIVAEEAFTVGAEAEGARLELDLNQLPGVPGDFRYRAN